MSSEPIISLRNVSKTYRAYKHPLHGLVSRVTGGKFGRHKEFHALNDISLDIHKGETVGIIGRNGSGKSTLLQIICGIRKPTSGSVDVKGRISALLELGSGFQPDFTGRENVFLHGAINGISAMEMSHRFHDIEKFAEIGEFIDQPIKTYSSGMMVRLAFSVAINVDPQILIIDEALSVGDEIFQRKCFSRIETIKKSGATILFVSHAGNTIVELCDRAVLLDYGELLATGLPKHIVGKYQKLVYAPQEKCPLIREEIRTSSDRWQLPQVSLTEDATATHHESIDALEIGPQELFDASLMPQSTLLYEPNGAVIESPGILNLSGENVNCLKRGKSYRYTFKVRFSKDVSNVRFGMLIKTLSGLELGGAVSSPSAEQSIPNVHSGALIRVEFRFTCNLNPGSYFLNAGVMGSPQNEEVYLHRILDSYMFKVMPLSNNTATSLVDFNCVADLVLMDNPMQMITTR